MQDPFYGSPHSCILVSQANTMEVHFHSDSSNNDWGVKMYAYGIMQVRPTTIAAMAGETRVRLRKISLHFSVPILHLNSF